MRRISTSSSGLRFGSQSDPATFWRQLSDLMSVSAR